MDPLRIAVRVVFIYVFLLVLVRIAGKRSVRHASPFDFTISLIIGDMLDDALWAEVGASVFAVGVGVLMMAHLLFDLVRYKTDTTR